MQEINEKPHILYVEDDESLSFVTKDNLELEGFKVTHCADGKQALELLEHEKFDLCILDVMLPEIDGFTVAKHLRAVNQEIPIIFLSAKSLKDDRITGLRIGADDYITKPFSIEELILKIEVFLKRSKVDKPTHHDQFQFGTYRFDYKNLTLQHGDKEKRLTQKEADLLLLFQKNKNRVLPRATILEQIWGENDYFLGRSLDVFISRLRKYLRDDPSIRIENIHGVGFKLII